MGENGPVSLTVEGEQQLEERCEQLKADFENARRDLENASDDSDIRAADEKKRQIKTQMDEIERALSHCTIIESRSELEERLEELKFTERPKARQEKTHSLDSLEKSRKEYEALAVCNGHEDEILKLEERLADCAMVEDRSVLEKKMNDLKNEKKKPRWN